ncbi:agmatinase [candidate division KSB3 bacterium]|uniref:Agmatinase n=1 Tax=candidate division KSB3 bacterium TaxID=2044937 RepID=A0A9D5Q698_9BACT|nr:agmatinase [candidate division KSB3 bacterium]MBD3325500.1 agmatinase [candidate division KSB3 bacterium]
MSSLHTTQFLGLEPEFTAFDTAQIVILPVPYEGGVSYGKGTADAPQAILEASHHLELYDEILDVEPFRIGIATLAPPALPTTPEAVIQTVYESTRACITQGKFVVLIGGDHSLSSGYYQALREYYGQVSVIQLDAHADLRPTYEDNPWSHACVMARIREHTSHTLQIGIRSLSLEEAERVKAEEIALCTMHEYRRGNFSLDAALQNLPDPVFLTLDVDVFDWSAIRNTGTPEPGGFLWDEGLELLQQIFLAKQVVGVDLVELAHQEHDRNSPFAAAKLIYKLLGFKYHNVSFVTKENAA